MVGKGLEGRPLGLLGQWLPEIGKPFNETKMDRGGCLNTRPARIHRGGCLNTRSARIHRGGCLNSKVSLNTQNGPWGLFKHACGHQIAASCSKVLKTERFRYDSVMVSDGCQFLEIAGDREAF